MTILTSTYPGNGSYAQMDDPTNLPAPFRTGTMNPAPGTGTNADLFQFSLTGNVTNRTIRVGLMVDNLDVAGYNAASLTLVQTNGMGATNGPIATTAGVFNDRIPDWVFFQISGAAAGDTFIVRGAGGTNGAATLGGVSFDSIPNIITNLSDSGPGSLRTVLAAMSPDATVTFAANLSGATILLTSGAITLNTSLAIDAAALPGGISINGNAASSIFQVNPGVTVVLNSVTITNGFSAGAGGGIGNYGSLTLNGCTVAGNTAGLDGGGIYTEGDLTRLSQISGVLDYFFEGLW
jgi:predicted outer membrane repeat protein